jgi:hypothetical protein
MGRLDDRMRRLEERRREQGEVSESIQEIRERERFAETFVSLLEETLCTEVEPQLAAGQVSLENLERSSPIFIAATYVAYFVRNDPRAKQVEALFEKELRETPWEKAFTEDAQHLTRIYAEELSKHAEGWLALAPSQSHERGGNRWGA